MRLKSLRKKRPAFETEGTVINGSRMDISDTDLKLSRHRSNNSFIFPASFNSELSSLTISPSEQFDELNTWSRQHIVNPTTSKSSNISPYQAIEAAYLEHGIRVRLSPTKVTASGQESQRKSASTLQRHKAFVNRQPSRTSSALYYATSHLDQYDDSRSFSVLQETFSTNFEQTPARDELNAHLSETNKELCGKDCYSTSTIVKKPSNSANSSDNLFIINDATSTTTLVDNDPDLVYMSSLLKQPSGESVREKIRQRAGLRGTFAVHRSPLIVNSTHPQQSPREKSSATHRNSLMRNATIEAIPVPTPSPEKLDKDILKHATRIRKTNQLKEYPDKSPRTNTTPTRNSPLRTNGSCNYKRNAINKPLKSISLESLQLLLAPAPHPTPLSTYDLPTSKTSTTTPIQKIPPKRTKSAQATAVKNSNTTNFPLKREYSASSALLGDRSSSFTRTSPIDIARQSVSFDSNCYDRSSSGGDVQSLTSSSLLQMPSTIPSARLINPVLRRPNTNKKVSFYEEATAVILTTATYV